MSEQWLALGLLVVSLFGYLAMPRVARTPASIPIGVLLLTQVGLARIETVVQDFALVHALAAIAFAAGVFLAYGLPMRKPTPKSDRADAFLATQIFAAVSIALTALHFALAGIPILSPNVEVDRWKLGSSGLFGIPSRLYIYGVLLALVNTVVLWLRNPGSDRALRLLMIVGTAAAASRIAGGFKGELLELGLAFSLVSLAYAKRRKQRSLIDRVGRTTFVVGGLLAGVAFAAFAGSLYSSSSEKASHELLFDRVTVGLARPAAKLAEGEANGHSFGEPFTLSEDLSVYTAQLQGREVTAGEALLVRKVSAELNGRSLLLASEEEEHFVVPTTPGLIALTWYNAGRIPTVFLMGAFGFLLAVAARSAVRSPSCARATVWFMLVHLMYVIIHKGEIVVTSLNYAAICLLFVATDRVAVIVSRQRQSPRGWLSTTQRQNADAVQ